ncbi:MAG: rhodanese-like domain-containing protein [Burkholderiales bacterium]
MQTQSVVNIDPDRLQKLIQERHALVLDVRTEQEVGRGMIAGARHIPLQQLPARMGELDRSRPLVIYCQSGARSMLAGNFLADAEWQEVYNLTGGVGAWLAAGLTLVQAQ